VKKYFRTLYEHTTGASIHSDRFLSVPIALAQLWEANDGDFDVVVELRCRELGELDDLSIWVCSVEVSENLDPDTVGECHDIMVEYYIGLAESRCSDV